MFTIGELSRLTDVKVPTIRYYEDAGLLRPSGRSAGNQRRYDQQGLERLSFIRHARELGLSISSITELIKLSENPEMSCKKAHEIAVSHLKHTKERILKLKKLQRELERIASSCDSGQVGECDIIQALADHGLCSGKH